MFVDVKRSVEKVGRRSVLDKRSVDHACRMGGLGAGGGGWVTVMAGGWFVVAAGRRGGGKTVDGRDRGGTGRRGETRVGERTRRRVRWT